MFNSDLLIVRGNMFADWNAHSGSNFARWLRDVLYLQSNLWPTTEKFDEDMGASGRHIPSLPWFIVETLIPYFSV